MEKICDQCKTTFESDIYFKRFCSETCRKKYWKLTNKSGVEYLRHLYSAKKIYEKSESIEEALNYLNERDKDFLAESISFLKFLYQDKTIGEIFELIKYENK